MTAIDASPTAVSDLARRAAAQRLPITVREADLRNFTTEGQFDSMIAIGLLMFFEEAIVFKALARVKELTKSGGIAVVNVLIKGTTYFDMFEPNQYYLFSKNEVPEFFGGWTREYLKFESFPAPNETVKCLCTLVARRLLP